MNIQHTVETVSFLIRMVTSSGYVVLEIWPVDRSWELMNTGLSLRISQHSSYQYAGSIPRQFIAAEAVELFKSW
jgi:hypothetical protein